MSAGRTKYVSEFGELWYLRPPSPRSAFEQPSLFFCFLFVFDQEPHEFSFIQSEHRKHSLFFFFFKDQPPAFWLFKCFHSQLYTKMSRFVWHVSELLTTEERQKRSPQQEQTDQKVTGSERRLGDVIAKRSNVPTRRVTSHMKSPAKTSYLSNKKSELSNKTFMVRTQPKPHKNKKSFLLLFLIIVR